MKFINNIDKSSLNKAVIEWVLGTDEYNGAIGGILGEIPWRKEMGFDYWEKNVSKKIDEAIGSRYGKIDGKYYEWELDRLITFNDNTEDTIAYRQQFQKFIEDKVDHIFNVYQQCIDELNEYLEKEEAKTLSPCNSKPTEGISLRDLQFKTQELIDGDNEVTDDFKVSLKVDAETGLKLVASNGKKEVEIMPL